MITLPDSDKERLEAAWKVECSISFGTQLELNTILENL